MIRTALLASALALASLTGAQAAGPRLVGGGDNAEVVYDAPSENVVGGGTARLTGGGENAQVSYSGPTLTAPGTGLIARLVGGGPDRELVYEAPAGSNARLAGAPANHGG
ncbi:hypothetical protein JYK14_28220 [Siccirubricoccus sp. KC 17139]|uniref:Uncharacterized protein n=1 Tax=Siccirubricoccus soli TaxID=2899147 RepID=A0ABT1DDJ7_9PROT|nr:hypothetical protein [Siccirubricoccus soli]MCO6420013.1 hypothetical protein [Siccirubricoccus soli]MCP2686150.1 hypothetical protein [Siccirubricoccus soli]